MTCGQCGGHRSKRVPVGESGRAWKIVCADCGYNGWKNPQRKRPSARPERSEDGRGINP